MLSFSVGFVTLVFGFVPFWTIESERHVNHLSKNMISIVDHGDCVVWETATATQQPNNATTTTNHHTLPTYQKIHSPDRPADLLSDVSSEASPLRGIQGGYGRGYCTPRGACHGICRSG